MKDIKTTLLSLEHSKFRSGFHLTKKEKEYVRERGMNIVKEHALAFLTDRIKPEAIPNDGKQTPYRGHPVFKAQHATACCCRGCIYKWHKIKKNKELSNDEINYLLELIMAWIEKEMEN